LRAHLAYQQRQQIQQELATIRNKTLKANPKLVKDIKAYETAFDNKAKALGYHPDQELKRLREIQTKARDQKTCERVCFNSAEAYQATSNNHERSSYL